MAAEYDSYGRPVESVTMQDAAAAMGNGTSIEVRNKSTASILLTGSMTNLAITFEATNDGNVWTAVLATSVTTSVAATTATAAGLYVIYCTAFLRVRARISTWVAGEVTAIGLTR